MPNNETHFLTPNAMLICMLILTIALFASRSFFFILLIGLGVVVYYYKEKETCYLSEVLLLTSGFIITFLLFFLLSGKLLTSMRYGIKLVIVLLMILLYIKEMSALELLESLYFLCTPLSFFGLYPHKISYELSICCLYIKFYHQMKSEILLELKCKGLDYEKLSWTEKGMNRKIYWHAIDERMQKRARNLSDMLEVKLYRIDDIGKNQSLEFRNRNAIVGIATCVLIFIFVILKEVVL